MAYTDVWDVTAPLDSQAASQGAADFRATKLDVMQRIASFGAGLLAARPTPELTSGTADWTGVMYWATDTRQTFRWSGAAWVDISPNIPSGSGVFIFSSGAIITAPVDITEDVIYTATVLANSMGATGGLFLKFSVTANISANVTVRVRLGGVLISDATFVITGIGTTSYEVTVLNNLTNAQTIQTIAYANSGASGVPSITVSPTAIDTTVNQILSVTVQKTTAGNVVKFYGGFAKLL